MVEVSLVPDSDWDGIYKEAETAFCLKFKLIDDTDPYWSQASLNADQYWLLIIISKLILLSNDPRVHAIQLCNMEV